VDDGAQDLLRRLTVANDAFMRHYDGPSTRPQPAHTLYWGAHRFGPASFARLSAAARESFATYAEDPTLLARALGFPGADALPRDRAGILALVERAADDGPALAQQLPAAWLAFTVHARVAHKLQSSPIEDLRIDFEDGYGVRSDADEDADAIRCAQALATALAAGEASPASGIRIKPLTTPSAARSIATLERFVTTLVERHGGVPTGFRVTLPKVQVVEHVEVACELLSRLERRLGLREGSVPLEIMVEVTQVFFDVHGRFALPRVVAAGVPRLVAIALGVYDFTASCGIAAAWQSIDHPMCDLARGLMMLGVAGTRVQLCDGSTNVLPVEPVPTSAAADETARINREAIWRAWRLSHDHVRRSLVGGWVQGWDLHPAQIPVRFAANYRFFLDSLPAATARLSEMLATAAAATDNAAILDDAATGQALLGFLQRARACGAIDDADLAAAGLRASEVRLASYPVLLAGRRAGS
jgi:citrate lyase beta subunit